jgi:glucosamine--fructose-6-phosphate aminotransferase (isomerizing)
MEGHDIIEKTVDSAIYIPRVKALLAPVLQLYHYNFYLTTFQ